jgi:hypothetical protein
MEDESDKAGLVKLLDSGPTSVEFPRRRLGRVVHDERGQASVEWERLEGEEARASRVALSVVEDPSPTARSLRLSSMAGGVNPYDRGVEVRREAGGGKPRSPADLRKLDAWIKQRRAVEALRNKDED